MSLEIPLLHPFTASNPTQSDWIHLGQRVEPAGKDGHGGPEDGGDEQAGDAVGQLRQHKVGEDAVVVPADGLRRPRGLCVT